MKKTPKALTSVGRMTACSWFTHCSSAISMNSGIDGELGRHHHRADDQREQQPLPRNCSLAKAKPASVQKKHRADGDRPRTR